MDRADAHRGNRQPTPREAAVHPQIAAEIVQETVEECERLLLDAEATAQEIREAAAQDAAHVRREAVRSNARLLTDLEQRRPQVEVTLAGARAVAERATRLSAGVVADAERQARDLASTAEARAKEVVSEAAKKLDAAKGQNAAAEASYREADERRSEATARLGEANALMAAATLRASEADALMTAATEQAAEADRRMAEATQVRAAAEATTHAIEVRSREVEARRAEVDERFAALWAASEAATAHTTALTASSEEWAADHRATVEAEALSLVAQAWRSSEALQRELLEEVDAEAVEITWQATLDATKIRDDAETEAREMLALARRQIDDDARATAIAALLAAPIVTLPSAPTVPSAVPDLLVAGSVEPPEPPEPEEPLAPEAPEDGPKPRSRRGRSAMVLVGIVVLGAVLIRFVVGTPYTVEFDSMAPTLAEGQEVAVNKLAYDLGEPARGDVVVLELAEGTLVKRVVGLPGEVVEGRDGIVIVDGRALQEPYLATGVNTSSFPPVELRSDEIFVLGDNRAVSSDSRAFGPVRVDALVGRAEAVLWPIGELRRL